MQYLTLQAAGFVAYCDALIGCSHEETFLLNLLSLIGTPSAVKALSSILFQGECCRLTASSGLDAPEQTNLRFIGRFQSLRSRKLGNTVNKIMVKESKPQTMPRLFNAPFVYGESLAQVRRRAFLLLDSITTIPLKETWEEWLWEEVMEPQRLYSFGDRRLQHAWSVAVPSDDHLQQQVMEGIEAGWLQ